MPPRPFDAEQRVGRLDQVAALVERDFPGHTGDHSACAQPDPPDRQRAHPVNIAAEPS
ncbi:hypothetical protein MYA_5221 [Burkholderia sp. KJ006]|nr:hypothetical protein MYA_5221 [Burkholderia sp. KJ006]